MRHCIKKTAKLNAIAEICGQMNLHAKVETFHAHFDKIHNFTRSKFVNL